MCEKSNFCSMMAYFFGMLVFVFSVVLVIFLVFDYKKKKEDRDLENYLENSIQ